MAANCGHESIEILVVQPAKMELAQACLVFYEVPPQTPCYPIVVLPYAFVDLCDRYSLGRPAMPKDVESLYSSKTDVAAFRDSAADPRLYALLRTFRYYPEYREGGPAFVVSQNELDEFRKPALDLLHSHLVSIISGATPIDDSSNAWWGVRIGIVMGDPRFETLLEAVVERFGDIKEPPNEVIERDPLPESRTRTRVMAYTLSNAQAIFEHAPLLKTSVKPRLEALIERMAENLLGLPIYEDIYNLSVHYESLRNYQDFVDDKYFIDRALSRRITREDLCPVGDFACGDLDLDSSVRALVGELNSAPVPGKRQLVLAYGSSSTGKTFLIEQLFKHYDGTADFARRRLLCSSKTDSAKELQRIIDDARASTHSRPFLFIDEADVEMPESIFPLLLKLFETGRIREDATGLDGFVLFWGGGKYLTVEGLRDHLTQKQATREYQKGIDVFNRSTPRMSFPVDLMERRSHKVMVGLVQIEKQFNRPCEVDWSVVSKLRSLETKGGVRDFKTFAVSLALHNGIIIDPKTRPIGKSLQIV
jgi:ATPase family associated with various cellular activities (AAA)